MAAGKGTFRSFFRKGLLMEQHKEPALSREMRFLLNGEQGTSVVNSVRRENIEDIASQDIILAAKLAHIVDENDGYLLYKKLRHGENSRMTILVDAVDDEPYVSSQMGPLLHLWEECVAGAALAQKVIGGTELKFLIYKNLTDLDVRIPKTIGGYPIKRISGVYPAENRIGGLMEGEKNDCILLGACSLIHLYRALAQGRMQTTAFVTVAGNCIGYPCNMEVSIGTPVTEVLHQCGLIDNPTRIVVGGSLTGVTIEDTDEELISPVTRAVLAFKENEGDKKYRCIGCGNCQQVCPNALNPMLIYQYIRRGMTERLARTDYDRCIGCMACSYICPAKLDVAGEIARLRQGGGDRP